MLSWPYLPLSAALALKLIFTRMVSLVMCPVIFIFTPLQLPVSRFSATEIHQPSRSLSTFHWTDINQCGFCFTSISSKLLKQHSDNIIISCSIVPLNNFYVSVVSFNIHIVLCYMTAMLSPYGCEIQSNILQFKLFHFIPPKLLVFAKKCFSFACTSANITLTALKAGVAITGSYIPDYYSQRYLLHLTFILIIVYCSVHLHHFICYAILGFLPLFMYTLKKKNRHYANLSHFSISSSSSATE